MPKVSNKINWETDSISFYKFICKDPQITFVYVGHTTNFRQRKSAHKSACCNPNSQQHNLPVYQFIRANGNWGNWVMVEIKSQICLSHRDAERVEQELINQEHQILNAHKAHSGVDLPSNHAEYHKQYQAQHYIQHKEEIAKYQATHKEEKAKYDAEYRANNKERIAEKNTQYRIQNKKKYTQYQAQYYKQKKIEKAQHNLFKTQLLLEILTTTELIE